MPRGVLRTAAAGVVLIAVVAVLWIALSAGSPGQAPGTQATPGVARGGTLIATVRSEPRSFNRYVGRDFLTELFTTLTQAQLVRINRVTQEIEPWLAERWACRPDGLSCTLALRKGVTFSDGAPFTSADVLFAFEAVYDENTGSPLAEVLTVDRQHLRVSAPDASTVVISFPSPFGPGLRILDNLPILPRHRLDAALRAGTLRKSWGVGAKPEEIAGLGPFVLREYLPGQRLVFARNARYWRRDARGTALPYLDGLTLEIAPDQNGELLRLLSGQSDFTQSEVRPDDYAMLKRAEAEGKIRLIDAGLGLDADCFWFNLAGAANAPARRRAWLQREELRRAVSLAVDRQAFANVVFLGAAEPVWGPVSPGNSMWSAPAGSGLVPRDPHDPARARTLLAGLGLRDVNGDGMLDDADGKPARFTLITQKGNTALERGASVIRDDMAKVGVGVDVVPLEVGALVDRMMKADYEALYFRFLATSTDPALNLDFWLSSGSAHVWNMSQAKPATDWERELDALMQQQVAELVLAKRQRLFWQAQAILAQHLPVLYFAVPRVYVATSTRVAGASPATTRPMILWSPDTLGVRAK
jgi:peptide/nickel transport system substrate-binding protein